MMFTCQCGRPWHMLSDAHQVLAGMSQRAGKGVNGYLDAFCDIYYQQHHVDNLSTPDDGSYE